MAKSPAQLGEVNMKAAEKWGRTEDLANGNMAFSYWGMPDHGYDPRAELD